MLQISSYQSEGEWLMTKYAKRITLIVAMVLMVPSASLGVASPALAAPSGIFSIFADCPLAAIRASGALPGHAECAFHQVTSGEVAIGSMKVPINQTITLQGGFVPTGNPANEAEYFDYPAEGGESISKTELEVPGGLPSLIDCREIKGWGFRERVERDRCRAFSFNGRTTGVTATAEIVANAENPSIYNEFALVREEGTAIIFPIRVHLKNQFLGSSCYIGSESSPLQLHLTTGATSPPEGFKSIHGALGETNTLGEDGHEMISVTGDSLVDNTFSAPGVEGCGESFSPIIDPILDGKLKLPSPAGYNTVILTGTASLTGYQEVEAIEQEQAEAEAKKKQEEAEMKKKQEEAEAKKKQEEAERRHWGHWPHWQPARGNGYR